MLIFFLISSLHPMSAADKPPSSNPLSQILVGVGTKMTRLLVIIWCMLSKKCLNHTWNCHIRIQNFNFTNHFCINCIKKYLESNSLQVITLWLKSVQELWTGKTKFWAGARKKNNNGFHNWRKGGQNLTVRLPPGLVDCLVWTLSFQLNNFEEQDFFLSIFKNRWVN